MEIIQSVWMLRCVMSSVIVPLEALNTVQCVAMTSCASLHASATICCLCFLQLQHISDISLTFQVQCLIKSGS